MRIEQIENSPTMSPGDCFLFEGAVYMVGSQESCCISLSNGVGDGCYWTNVVPVKATCRWE